MGTGNSKIKEEKKNKQRTDSKESNQTKIFERKKSETIHNNMELQPMRRYNRNLTLMPGKINLDNNQIFSKSGLNSQNKNSRKNSEEYCYQFKKKYQEGENNSFLFRIAEFISHSTELTKEQIEIIRKKYMPKYIFDWKLEIDEKTGEKFWKKNGKIYLNDEIMNEMKNMLNSKKPIKSSEPFYKKRAWLFHYFSQNIGNLEENPVLIVDKKNIFESSFKKFKEFKQINFKLSLKILFKGEEANNKNNINREWYRYIFKDIFSKERKLFIKNNRESLEKNTIIFYPKYPGMNMEHYEFVGNVLLKAFFDRIEIKGLKFNIIILNHLFRKETTIEDLKYYDLNLYKSLKLIKDSVIKGNKELENINFIYKIKDENNNIKEIELLENGKNIFLNDENKFKYIEKVIYQETIIPFEEQIKYLQKGIYSIMDENLRGIFSADELNFLLSGLNEIDINDWEENTEYKGDYNPNHEIIKMFWDKIRKLNKEELTKFLEFSTGLSSTPIDGFGSLKDKEGKIKKFTIEPYINYSEEENNKNDFILIEAKTNYNTIRLPEYKNSQEMEKAFGIIFSK